MKQKYSYMMLALLLSVLWIPLGMQAQDATEVLQPQFGKQTVTVKTGQELTFYDFKGTEKINSTNSSNSQSLTVFKPEEAGMTVQITFESVDVQESNASYMAYLNVYNGEADADNSFKWATAVSEVGSSSVLPDGDLIEQLKGKYTNKVYYSTDATGALSVGFLYRYAETCEGWTAKVKCVKLEDQTTTGAGSDYTSVPAAPNRKQGLTLGSAFVTTTGLLNADNLTAVSFKLTKNDGVVDPSALKLYAGKADNFSSATPLDATLSNDGDTYTFTLSKALGEGNNYFSIAGDILATAAVGAEAQIEITGVKTTKFTDGVKPFTAGTPVALKTPAVILMSATPQTVTVGDDAISFYDDGGIDGQVTKGFNGQVTFLPATADKKVMIDFTKVKIFYGSIRSQSIKVYNGKEKNAASLLKTLNKQETATIRSTSDDGALTVVFESTTDGFTDDGFEATVQQFTPQAMTLTAATATQITDGTVCAGDADQQIMRLNLTTKDTEPALTAKKFSFTTNGTSAQISHATLYYTKQGDAFATTTKVGETDVTADQFDITAATEVSLIEGDNYFWLTYNISDLAENGKKVDAAATTITLSDGPHTVEGGNPEGDRTVENIVYSQADQGTVTKNVNGSITFKTKNYNEYSERYEPGNDDRINVFKPMKDGTVCQIDFSQFDLYYSTSSYGGVRAKLKVYNGTGTTGKILWELSSPDDKTTGPGRTLRSTAADGAITVLFNPSESASYYTANGFTATVSEYKDQPMEVQAVTATQTTTADAPIGAAGQDVLSLNVNTIGASGPKSLNSVSLNLKDSEASITKVSLYKADGGGTTAATGATPLAEATVDGTAKTATLTLATPMTLEEGDNWLRIRYDISGEAAENAVIDAAVTSVNIGGTDISVTDGDPAGGRTLKNIYLLQSGENGTVTVTPGKNIMFYDDGGADGNASLGFNGTVTFAPKNQGDVVVLTFKSFDAQNYTTMSLYSGGEVKDKADAEYTSSGTPLTAFSSTADDGKVTVSYTTPNVTATKGFAIEVSSRQRMTLTATEVAATGVAPEKVLKGQADVAMTRVDVKVEGDNGELDINKFAYDALGAASAVSAVRVYATGTSAVFAPTNLFGEAAADKTEVEGSYKIAQPGTYTFWIAANIATDAAENAVASITLNSLTANGQAVSMASPVTASATVKKGASGTLTVGAGADYGTIQAAIDAIKDGIEGPVTINVKRGIYNEKVEVPEIPGASETNTVTVQSETGSYNDVKVYYDRYTEPAYSDDKMAQEYGVFTIAGADWFTLRGIELTTADLSFPSVVHIKNVSRHVTIDSCYVHADMTTDYSNDINLIYTYSKNEENQNNDFLTVRNCLIDGGYIGIRMYGTGYVALPKEVGGVIEGNTLTNQGSKGIYVMDELGAKIRHNSFIYNGSPKSGFQAIDCQLRDTYHDSFVIEGNVFDMSTSVYSFAFNPRQLLGTAEAPVLFINNEIRMKSDIASSSAVKIGSPCEYLYIANNTIRMTGTKDGGALWFNDNMKGNVKVENNIIQSETGGYVYRFYKADGPDNITFSNNSVSTTGAVFAYNKSDIATFGDWKTLSGETGSYNDKVTFLSDDILEPAEEGNLLNAKPLAYVATDINGTQRSADKPTIGAYEYADYSAAPQMAAGYPAVTDITDSTATVSVMADQSVTAYVIVRGAAEAAPTAEDLRAADLSAAVRKNSAGSLTAAGLVKDNDYKAYILLENLRGVATEVTATAEFKATSDPIAEIPAVKVTALGDTVAAGQTAVLRATVTEGTAPFTIRWTKGDREEIGTLEADTQTTVSLDYTPAECDLYYVSVTDANGKTAADTCRVTVTGEAVTATFDNLYLDSESNWHGPDTKGTLVEGTYGDEMVGSFVSGSYAFGNAYNTAYDSWSGFAYSNSTSTSFKTLADQYNSATGIGYDNSANFAVAFGSGTITVLNNAEGDSIRGMYITGSAYANNTILNGDSYAKKFGQGDWLKVTFTGTRADGTTSTIDYYLADYRPANAADHYCLDTWQWADLRPLGKVKSIAFAIDGSDSGAWGLNTPAYFCIDNVNGERVIRKADTRNTGEDIDLAGLFTFDDKEATVTYAFADAIAEADAPYVTLKADGTLTVSSDIPADVTLIISATQKGKTQFISLPVQKTSGVNAAETVRGMSVKARYSADGRRLNAPERGVNIVLTEDGKSVKVVRR